ncbi:hypothetical protein [Nocardiopsis lambiniae]|uniref:DUF998 domain-containing protein n=1 Tax=Nocardiopsis lambiniae TaxID=3075539 RepID=A0ABU2M9R7_9ACTN|nr:hypothetical protein [Nocardiopsis sp. DSM 44743]MDT0328910.1 hypothetical protein [Nocardiopsis sp. DSM 44743]
MSPRPARAAADPRSRATPWAVAAASWSLLYVVSKVEYALAGRPGVTGGPEVGAASYAAHGPGEVAAAQWANAGVGLVVVLLFAACALPAARRAPRWLSLPPVGAVALMATVGAVVMVGRDVFTGSGGTPFGLYCPVWAVLSAGVLVALARGR